MKKIFVILICLFLMSEFYAIARQNDASKHPLYANDLVKIKLSSEAVLRSQLPLTAYAESEKTNLNELDQLFALNGVTSIVRAHISAKDKNWVARTGFDRWFLLRLDGSKKVEQVLSNLKKNRYIEKAIPEYYFSLDIAPNDPLYPNNWGHNNTAQLPAYEGDSHSGPGVGIVGFDSDAELAWDYSQVYGDSTIIIAILDTGVDTAHPDLRLITGYDFGDNDDDPMDDSWEAGHGTCTSGIAAAIANNNLGVAGIAGGCSVMPLKVADSEGNLTYTAAANALIYAADHNANVVSMSFGSSSEVGENPDMDNAIEYAYDNGVVIFASAGNTNGSDMQYPAKHPDIIAVGAASPSGERKNPASSDGEFWWGSTYGANQQDAADAIDIMAPTILPSTDISGENGYSNDDYYMWFNGTSCSSPYAAGVAALVLSMNPDLTPAEVRTILTTTATDMTEDTAEGWDRWTGYGLVNAEQALLLANPGMPQCHIVYPFNNTGFDLNSIINVQVAAADSVERSVMQVGFYLDDNTEAEFTDLVAPYEWTWNTAGYALGMHIIKAVAIDNDNNHRQHQVIVSLLNPANDGFESGDFSGLNWHNQSSSPWTVQNDAYFSGSYSARSGSIDIGSITELKLKVNITQEGDINFYRKVSSLTNGGFLRFYIDGELQGEWSGEKDWSLISLPVEIVLRTFSWKYEKNANGAGGDDCCWIDHIILPANTPYFWPPQNLTAAGGYGFVLIYWQAPEAGNPISYNIYRNDVLLTNYPSNRYTDTDVVNGTSYTYRIVAVFANGESESTESQTATPTSEVITETIIGVGTTATSNNGGCPINNYRKSLHGQMVYTARELNLQGVFGPTNITRLGFYVDSAPLYALPNFKIRIAHTTAENAAQWHSENLVVCYQTDNYRPVAGNYDMLTLSTPFLWNGIDNIVIDTAFNLTPATSASGTVFYSEVANGYLYTRSNTADQTDEFTDGVLVTARPNLKLSILTQPEITLNTTSLSFGNVLAGFQTSKTFNITNSGTGYLSGEITMPNGFYLSVNGEQLNSMTYAINADSTSVFTVLFAPDSPGVYDGNIEISHNAESETRYIMLNAVSLIAQTTPFIDGFENGFSNWCFANEEQTNKWFFGSTAPQAGTNGLFISGDGGNNNTYLTNRASISYAYRDIQIPEGTENAKLRFSWKCVGEGTGPYFDFLRVFCVDPNVIPQAGIMLGNEHLGGTLNLSNVWKEADVDLPQTISGGAKRIVFAWRNDSSGGNQPPAAIDNMRVLLNSYTDYAFVSDSLATVNIPAVSDTLGHTFHTNLIISGITNPSEHLWITSGFASLNEPFSDTGLDFTISGANFSGAEITFNYDWGYIPSYLGYKIDGKGIWMTHSADPDWTTSTAHFTIPVYYGNTTQISFCFPQQNNLVSPYQPDFTAALNDRNKVVLSWKNNFGGGISSYQIWRGSSHLLSSAVQVSDFIPESETQENYYTYTDSTTVAYTRYYYWLKITNIDESAAFWGSVLITTSNDPPLPPPPETALIGIYPNPFKPLAKIEYSIKAAGKVEFKIYNYKGQLVNSFSQSHSAPGIYTYEFNGHNSKGRDLASGLYILYMKVGNKTFVHKMVKTK
ncbi:MAG: S8 family serine peptidase [Candidatus Cloacimonas sp.]